MKSFLLKTESSSEKNSKEKTGRIVWFKEFGIKYSFTLESSFFGREHNAQDADGKGILIL